jgi:hypothetical protein
MPKEGAYLVTTADVSDPREARRLLRKQDGHDTLAGAMQTCLASSTSFRKMASC